MSNHFDQVLNRHRLRLVMETVRVPFEEAVRLVMDGTITHGPSCVLILKAVRVMGR